MSAGAVAEPVIDPATDRLRRLAEAERRLHVARAAADQAAADVRSLHAAVAAASHPQPPRPADLFDEQVARDLPAPRRDPPPLTAADWPTCSDPNRLLTHVAGRMSERKLRLVTVAAARLVWDTITSEMREAVDTAERLADGQASAEELQWFRDRLFPFLHGRGPAGVQKWSTAGPDRDAFFLVFAATDPSQMVRRLHNTGVWSLGSAAHSGRVAPLVRDIVGDPFHPATFEPAWRTADVIGLAEAAYERRAFDRLPILADALEDAGCQDQSILTHCRSGGPHVRGCWVVDLALGRS
jgi:hypothetical protein